MTTPDTMLSDTPLPDTIEVGEAIGPQLLVHAGLGYNMPVLLSVFPVKRWDEDGQAVVATLAESGIVIVHYRATDLMLGDVAVRVSFPPDYGSPDGTTIMWIDCSTDEIIDHVADILTRLQTVLPDDLTVH